LERKKRKKRLKRKNRKRYKPDRSKANTNRKVLVKNKKPVGIFQV